MQTPTTLLDVLYSRAESQGACVVDSSPAADRIAFTFLADGEQEAYDWTYEELACQSRLVAAELIKQISPRDRVLLLYPSGLDFLVGFFGCLTANVIAVPAYPPKRKQIDERLQAIFDDAQPALVLTTKAVKDRLPELPVPVLATDELESTDAEQATNAGAVEATLAKVTPEAVAFLQYTSGSTGTPKGVMVTHKNILANAVMQQESIPHPMDKPAVSWLPLFHDMGLIGVALQTVYLGTRLVFMPPTAFLQKPARWLQAISRYKAYTSGAPNFAYDLCVDKVSTEQAKELDLRSWQIAFNGAEPVREETMQRFSERFGDQGFQRESFVPCYGMAETTLFVACNRSHSETGGQQQSLSLCRESLSKDVVKIVESNGQTVVSCGKGPSGQRIAIVNPTTGKLCGPDEVGEIWVAGSHVTPGYWGRTSEVHGSRLPNDEGSYLRTGDLGFLKDGSLYITGRLKDLIIVRGKNYYPQDIERVAVNSHKFLTDAALFAVDTDGGEEALIVLEVAREHRNLSNADSVLTAVRKAVVREFGVLVHGVVLVKPFSLPKTSSGKIRRRECKRQFEQSELSVIAQNVDSTKPAEPPHTLTPEALQDLVTSWLACELKLPSVQPTDSLFDLPLDSLKLIELLVTLEGVLGRSIDPEVAYENEQIQKFVQALLLVDQTVKAVRPPIRKPLPRRQQLAANSVALPQFSALTTEA